MTDPPPPPDPTGPGQPDPSDPDGFWSGPPPDEDNAWLADLGAPGASEASDDRARAWGPLSGPERRRGRWHRVGLVLGAALTAVVLVATVVVGARVAVPQIRDRLAGAPSLFSGSVTRQGSQAGARPSPAAGVQVDVYLDPVVGGQPVALAGATTDRRGNFTLHADPPGDMDRFAVHHQVEATVVYQDDDSAASTSVAEDLLWDPAARRWRLLSPDVPGGANGGRAVVALVVPPTSVPWLGCHPDTHLMVDWMRQQVEQELAQAHREGRCP